MQLHTLHPRGLEGRLQIDSWLGVPLKHDLKAGTVARRSHRNRVVTQALHIDRRRHLEAAWKKQVDMEVALQAEQMGPLSPVPTEVRTLAHLENLVAAAGSSVVVVAFYSSSCGACKGMLQHYQDLCKEVSAERAGVRFLKHNVRDEYDDFTEITRLYRVKTVPCFLFFADGAMLQSVRMPDSRVDPGAIRKLMGKQSLYMDKTLRELLFRRTPSARR